MQRAAVVLVLLAGLTASATPVQAVIVVPDVELSINKSASADVAFPGDPVSYTLDVVNSGLSQARRVQVIDTLPAQMRFHSAEVIGATGGDVPVGCDHDGAPAGGTVLCELGNISPFHVGTNTVQVRIDVVAVHDAAAACTNTATVRSFFLDSEGELAVLVDKDPSNDTAATTQACRTPSITVVKQAEPQDGTPFSFTGDLGAFELAVPTQPSHTFADLAPGTYAISEALPPGWTLRELTCSDGSPVDLAMATATVELAQQEEVTCTFSNQGLGSITVVKQAAREDGTPFSFTGDLGAFELVLPTQPSRTFADLALGTYAITEALPPGWELRELTCSDGSLADLAMATATVELAAGEQVTCTFRNSPVEPPPEPPPDPAVTIDDDKDPVAAGELFHYRVNLANMGGGTAAAVQVEVTLADGVTLVSLAASGCEAGAQATGSGLLLTTPPGLRRGQGCTVSVPVRADGPGPYRATATIVQGGGDPSNDRDVEFTAVTAPRLELTQEVLPGPLGLNPTTGNAVFAVGTPATFVIRVTNRSLTDITNVQIGDRLPPGLTYVSDGGGGAYAAPNWTVGTLPAGAVATLRITARVDTTGPLTNTATVVSADGEASPRQASVTVEGVAVLAAAPTAARDDILPATGLSLFTWFLLGLMFSTVGSAMVMACDRRSAPRRRYG